MVEFARIVALVLMIVVAGQMQSQCIIINEVLVNASGNCDGNCVPNTAEWIELHNTCNTALNIGCYVLTDGDFSITFPGNTTIEANGYFVIGSDNSGVPVDIDLATCNCTSGADSEIGILTNGNEQLALVNASGQLQDGIYWGSGQFAQTPSFTTDAMFGCFAQTIQLASASASFAQVPTADDGQTVYRSCSDPAVWLADGLNYTPGNSNGDDTGTSLTIIASPENPCEGDNATLTASGTAGNFTWNNEQSGNSIVVSQSGTYTVSVESVVGCGSSASISLTFQDAPSVDAGSGGVADCDEGFQLEGSTNGTAYFWEPSIGLDDPTVLSPIAMPTSTTVYTLHAQNGECESTSSVTIVPECGNLNVPNVFTPNNDGLNDVFRPDGKGVANYSLQVFNRWGKLIFETTQYNNGWNGKIDNEPAPAGTYFFLLQAQDSFGNSLFGGDVMEGEVTLLR
jgi:gliding motility-associated-like protein